MANTVQIEGLKELRRDLRRMELKAEGRGLTKALKVGAEKVAEGARPLAPRRTGKLSASYRAGAAGTTAFVRSRLPYAGVQEFGGTIRPKGGAVKIMGRTAVTRSLRSKEDVIVDLVSDAIDQLALKHGWH